MDTNLLEDHAPNGASFKSNGSTYWLKPNFYNRALIRKLKEAVRKEKRIAGMAMLQTLDPNKTDDHTAELREIAVNQITQTVVTTIECTKAMQDADYFGLILFDAIEGVETLEQAEKIADEANPFQLINVIAEASGVSTLKNSDSPEDQPGNRIQETTSTN